jgi:tetratricopeptide (TPR) repeat protein
MALCLMTGMLTLRQSAAGSGADAASNANRAQDEKTALIEAALYTRAEFFGAQALVPYPTAEARNRLADVQEKFPDEPRVLLKLSELDEKLGREEQAVKEIQSYVQLQPSSEEALEKLADFAHRRAQFVMEAATLERLLSIAPNRKRAGVLQRLIGLAHAHGLQKYLAPGFYEEIIAQDPTAFEIIEAYLDQLISEKNYTDALRVLRQYKERFPERKNYLIEKEVSILSRLGQSKEAEQVYVAAFDPFWPDELSENFYEFLKSHDRFRAYGYELREAFRRDPANFDVAVKLVHYSAAAYRSDPGIFVQLEKARAARGLGWKPEELATIARLLIAHGYGDAASRFLYTLYTQGGMKPGSELRAKVLYQLFELMSDAEDERISLTRGDLKFYQDIASADPHPGMLGGVLSLVLNDTNPAGEFRDEEDLAVKHFNRAAAYRLFNAYRQEYPTSPELAQMYLDLVRLYTATGETEVAAETLAEFEKRYADAPQYADVALRLADAYIAADKSEDERATYQRIMDYLGKKRLEGASLMQSSPQQTGHEEGRAARHQVLDISSEPAEASPSPVAYSAASNPGIEIPRQSVDTTNFSYNSDSKYEDYLGQPESFKSSSSEAGASSNKERDETRHGHYLNQASSVDYPTVLERYVSSLAKDKRTGEILALYSAEIKKYPNEPALYEQMLQWLNQTNLVEEQLRVYQDALKQFPTMLWRDRLARWFLHHERKQEFASFSRTLLESLDDEETESYLSQFVSLDYAANATSFDANLYLGFYSLAHGRFPHDLRFVQGLLKFYSAHEQWDQWRLLMAEYYFESREIRDQFQQHFAKSGELRGKLDQARAVCNANAQGAAASSLSSLSSLSSPSSPSSPASLSSLAVLPYKLFRADAAVWLSNYEEAIDAYRELNRLYPNTPEFSERLIAFTRSLGQHNRRFLEESASAAHDFADAFPASPEYRTRAGEIQAELGDYAKAKGEWEQLVALGPGEAQNYLETATIYWDYFQYEDALRTIKDLRGRAGDERLYAFQAGAILEARHQMREALAEYVKALAADEIEDDDEISYGAMMDESRAENRLAKLYRRPGIPAQLDHAFAVEKQHSRNPSELVLSYAGLLKKVEHWKTASALLKQEVARHDSQGFLVQALNLFKESKDAEGIQRTLKRLITIAQSPRFAISYRLQLAEADNASGQRGAASATLHELVQKFPTNYGVLSEVAGFYRRMGQRRDSLLTLRAGMERGKGKYHYVFARRLAAQDLEMGQAAAAERVLKTLHEENHLNTEVFHELAGIYVRTGNREALKSSFHTTLDAIKGQDIDIKEMRMQIADLRQQMIEAFTQLKDYNAAIEQYIEIINRDPDDEEKLDQALAYARRYGGAETLLAYYQRISQQAYKNYRWNVVLARIFETRGDLQSAARNYRAAIDNQPEMLELYDALAGVYTRGKDYDAALKALGKATELSNDDPQYVKRTIEVLLKAGRTKEAEIARRKLPAEEMTQGTALDKFALAASLRSSERSKAIETYRQAWNAFSADPYKQDLQASELTGYVQTVRDEEGLDQIMGRLWDVRERLMQDAERAESVQAGKARSLLQVLDGAIPEALGGVAASKGTGDELSALFRWLQKHIEESTPRAVVDDKYGTLALLQNLSRRAGFGSLEEKILLARKDGAYANGNASLHHEYLRRLSNFYSERGDYKRVLDLLENERARDTARKDFDYTQLMADNARLVGDSARELQALRDYYGQAGASPVAQADPIVERYFQALYANGEEGRNELLQHAQHPSAYHLQLVNFLLHNGEKELAHRAIDNAALPLSWKSARNAEASLALGDFDARNEAYFANALQYSPIGELIKQKPDASVQLVGDDWFHLAEKYGQWLYLSGGAEQKLKSRALLPAMIENRPQDVREQSALARWYLDQHEAQRALEHFRLALESEPEDRQSMAGLGSAYFMLGDKRRAEEWWTRIIAGERPSLPDCGLYLRTLARHGMAAEARERLFPSLAKYLKEVSVYDNSYDVQVTNSEFEKLKPLLRALSSSFGSNQDEEEKDKRLNAADEAARGALFRRACDVAPGDTLLPEMLIRESLIGQDGLGQFYELLVEHSTGLTSYDSDSEHLDQLQKSWNAAESEETLDQELGYKINEPKARRLDWQKEYLAYLVGRHETQEARGLINAIEAELSRRYARPVWLRLAALRLDVREGGAAKAVDSLKHLVGIEAGGNATKISPPDTARLNDVVAMLRSEGQEALASQLLEAAYERALALEQYEPSYFAGLARAALARGDAASGLKMLESMVNLSDEERRPEALALLASMPSIKAHAEEDARGRLPESHNGINRAGALRLAAETAGEFAQFDAAIGYRQQLLAVAPEDEANRIELARLLSADGKDDEAVAHLASIISDRNATRHLRWQAVWLAPEIAGERPELWTSLREKVRAANVLDQEMTVALEAVKLSQGGRAEDALNSLSAIETENPNPELEYFHALLLKRSGHDDAAFNGFVKALISSQDAQAAQAFAFNEDGPLPQLVRLYLALGQPRAALNLAEREPALKPEDVNENEQPVKQDESAENDESTNKDETVKGAEETVKDDEDDKDEESVKDDKAVMTTQVAGGAAKPVRDERQAYLTLDARAAERRAQTRLSLLGLLSEAAEQTGDLDRALKLARGRLALLPSGALKKAAAQRLEHLLALQRAQAGAKDKGFTVDQNLVAQR